MDVAILAAVIVATWRGWLPLPDDDEGGGATTTPSSPRCPAARGPAPTTFNLLR